MPVTNINGVICFVRLELMPGEVPGLLRRHAANYPGAVECEQVGAAIIDAGFPTDDVKAFVEAVVRWGGGQRFVGRLLNQNAADEIADALKEASAHLKAGEAADAVSRLQRLRYLGQSFASKIARFLSPTTAVILDEVIRGALGYRESQEGYQEFLTDCQETLELLVVHHPQLRICDVEAAIFAKIQKY
jgi:hypothetical protein